jgi:hypothetical protein
MGTVKNLKIIIPKEECDKIIASWRTFALNVVEASLVHNPEQFQFIRSKLLRSFGENGLQGDISKYAVNGEVNDEDIK